MLGVKRILRGPLLRLVLRGEIATEEPRGDMDGNGTPQMMEERMPERPEINKAVLYRGENKGLYVLLSRTQAGPGRTVKQEQEEISRNHVQTFICLYVMFKNPLIRGG